MLTSCGSRTWVFFENVSGFHVSGRFIGILNGIPDGRHAIAFGTVFGCMFSVCMGGLLVQPEFRPYASFLLFLSELAFHFYPLPENRVMSGVQDKADIFLILCHTSNPVFPAMNVAPFFPGRSRGGQAGFGGHFLLQNDS